MKSNLKIKLWLMLANTLNNLGTSSLVTGVFATLIYETVGVIQLQVGLSFSAVGVIFIILSWVLEMSTEVTEE